MPAFPSDGSATSTLNDVFAEPPFGSRSVGRELIEKLMDWYHGSIGDLHASDPIIFWSTMVGLTLLLALLAWHLIASGRAVWRALRRGGRVDSSELVAEKFGDLTAARERFEAGEFRRTVELSWSAVVDRFMQPGEVECTPRQQVRKIEKKLGQDDLPSLRDLLLLHEEACYAGKIADAGLARRALEGAAEILGEQSGG